ncbi:MAG TPA: hypothetical protein VFO82_01175 [Steroidobacteraceae bacterium]|nr:hypothetical protein [Steroidobacteraceae bacterium]
MSNKSLVHRRRKAYLPFMNRLARKFAKPLTLLVIAAQLLLAVPAMASVPAASQTSASMPCDGMPMPTGDDPCPCCPDGATSMTDCLVSCLLTAATAPTILLNQAGSVPTEDFVDLPHAAHTLSDPPLKPPPIA